MLSLSIFIGVFLLLNSNQFIQGLVTRPESSVVLKTSTLATYCSGFSTSNTNSATSNYAVCSITACPGETVVMTTLSPGSCSGDTYLKLYDPSNGANLAENDDFNGTLCSQITYSFTASCRTYELREGCYGSTACGGQVYYSGSSAAVSQPPTTVSTKLPTTAPSTRASVTSAPSTRASVTSAPSTRVTVPTVTVSSQPPTAVATKLPTTAPSTRAPVTSAPSTRAPVTSAPSTRAPVPTVTAAPTSYASSTLSPTFRSGSLCPAQSATPITYNSGSPVMLGTIPIYIVWYGSQWTSLKQSIIRDFINTLTNSDWLKIQTTYYQQLTPTSPKQYVSASVTLAKDTTDSGSFGSSITQSNIQSIVNNQINSGIFPQDTNAIYFVLTSAEILLSGYCSSFCGYHTGYYRQGNFLKFSFVGDSAQCVGSCAPQGVGPNGDAGADGTVSVIAHEITETITDANGAWRFPSTGYENADQCAWKFGNIYRAANGAFANMRMGSRDFLVQQNWIVDQNQCCMTGYSNL